jgi:hypothetical protein
VHPVAAAADEARERRAAPGVRLDEDDRVHRSHEGGNGSRRSIERRW